MYPYHFAYLRRNEQGPTDVDPLFETTYFPPSDRGDKWECQATHVLDLLSGAPAKAEVLCTQLVAEDPEKEVLQSVNILPSPLEDIYGDSWCVC